MIRFDTVPLTGSTVQHFIDRADKIDQSVILYCDLTYFLSFYKAYLLGKNHPKNIKVLPATTLFVNIDSKFIATVNLIATTQKSFISLSQFLAEYEAKLNSKQNCSTIKQVKYDYLGQKYPIFELQDLINLVNSNDNLYLLISTEPRSLFSYWWPQLLALADNKNNDQVNNADIKQAILNLLINQKAYLMLISQNLTHTAKPFTTIIFENGIKLTYPSHYRAATDVQTTPTPLYLLNKLSDGLPKKILYIVPTIGKNINTTKYGKVAAIINRSVALPLFKDQSCYQTYLNKQAITLANKLNIKPLIWYIASYAAPEDKIVQDVRLSGEDVIGGLPYLSYMRSYDELKQYLIQASNILNYNEEQAQQVVDYTINTLKSWGQQFELNYDSVQLVEPEPVNGKQGVEAAWEYFKTLIKKYDRLPKSKDKLEIYLARLKYELNVLSNNGHINLLPYFIPIIQVLDYYYDQGQLTGPARGSAAGSLLLYLIGITHVDPIKYDLSFDRFLSLARIKNKDMPDVDVDLSDRTLLVGSNGDEKTENGNTINGFLWEKYGNRAAQISTRSLLRLKSSIKDVNRFFHGRVLPEIEELTKKLPSAPQGISDTDFVFGYEDADGNHVEGLINTSAELQEYIQKYPNEWEVVKKMLGVSRQYSKHASAFVISNQPIYNTIPVFLNGRVTQYEAKEVEKAGLIKYDFLVVNQLKDIHNCIQKINQKHNVKLPTGHFVDVDGSIKFIWDLPEKEEVFRAVWESGDTTSLFQINTDTMRSYLIKMRPQSIEDLAVLLALVRPGPMDYVDPQTQRTMADEYLIRRFNLQKMMLNNTANDHSEQNGHIIKPLMDLLPETYGIMIYQEQNTKVAREIGKMSAEDAEELRRAFAKKQLKKALELKPIFMKGAIETVGEKLAAIIWEQMETSARYSFNKSHAVSYAFITYATMYLRHFYPLEWWAAVLENTDEHEFNTKLYPSIKHLIAPPTVNATTQNVFIDYKNNKIRMPLSLLKTIGHKTVEYIVNNAPYKNLFDFIERSKVGVSVARKLLIVGVLDELYDEEVKEELKKVLREAFNGQFYTFQDKMRAILLAYIRRKKKNILPEHIALSAEDLQMDDLKLFLYKKAIYAASQDNYFLELIEKRLKNINHYQGIWSILKNWPIRSIEYHHAIKQAINNYKDYYNSSRAVTHKLHTTSLSYIENNGQLYLDEKVEFKYLVPGILIDYKWFQYVASKTQERKTALKMQIDFGYNIREEVVVWPPGNKNNVEDLLVYGSSNDGAALNNKNINKTIKESAKGMLSTIVMLAYKIKQGRLILERVCIGLP